MRSRWISALLLVPLAAHALPDTEGNEVGNGGNAIVCRVSAKKKSAIAKVELLDIYEGRVLRGAKLDPKMASGEAFAIARQRFELLGRTDPKSSKAYLQLLHKLKPEVGFERDIKLKVINDSKHAFEPKSDLCKVQQLAYLRKASLPGEKRLLVEKNLWDKMSAPHRAGLVVHEVVYEYLAALGEKDSVKARFLVTYLLSADARTGSIDAYWDMMQKLMLPIYP